MEKNQSGEPNMNSSLNSLTNYLQRPVCQINLTSTIPTTETSLTVVQKAPISTCNSPQTNKKKHVPSIAEEYRLPNVKVGERADLPSAGVHSNIGMCKETSSFPARTVQRISESPGRILSESHQPRTKMIDRYPKSPSGITEESPCSPTRMVDRYPRSPSGTSGGSPHPRTRMIDRYAQSPSRIPETSPQTPTSMFDRYLQSPSAMSEGSSQPPTQMVDRYLQSPSEISERSPRPPTSMVGRYPRSPSAMSEGSQPPTRMVDRYPQSPSDVSEGFPQPPSGIVDRYLQSPSGITEGSFQPLAVMADRYSPSPSIISQPPNRMRYLQSPSGITEGSLQTKTRIVDRYPQSPSGVPEGSPQPPIRMVDRYLQSPLGIPAASPQSPSEIPEISRQPPTRMVNRYTQPPTTRVVNYSPHFSAGIPERSPPAFRLANTYSRLPVGIHEGFPQPPNRTVDSYSQSPLEVGEGASQLHTRVTDQSLQSPTQIPRGSLQPTTMMINRCLQPPLLGVLERPPQSPGDGSSYRQKIPDDIPLSCVGRTQCETNLTYSENIQRTTLDQSRQFSKSNFPMETTNKDNTLIQVDPSSDESCSSNRKLSFSSKNGADDLIDAQQILQKQLMAKQSQLQNVIQDQKRQLTQIQQQICLNAQAQYSLQEITDFETSKQFQRQAQILELERKQQEARHRGLKSFVALKVSPTTVDTNDTKTIQQVMQLSSCSAAQPLGIEATGGQHALAVSTQSVITSAMSDKAASTSSQNILSPINASKQLSFSTNAEISTQTINTSAQITSATTTSTEEYFSKFTSSELETFLSASSLSSSSSLATGGSSPNGHTEKDNKATQSSYDTLLVQQKQLLDMQADQRRKLLMRQQEELLRIQHQQRDEMLLLQLEHSSLTSQEHTEQEPTTSSPQTQDHENRNLISQSSGVLSGEPEQDNASTYELSEEDQCVINMLLNEGSDLSFWPEDIFKRTNSVP